eukprot:461434-Pelagomonas_calceolata.AAC.17
MQSGGQGRVPAAAAVCPEKHASIMTGLSGGVMWDLLGVRHLNKELSSSVSPIELELSKFKDMIFKDYWDVSTA